MPTLYADEDVSRLLAEDLGAIGLSVTSVRLEHRLGRKDDEHLLFAHQRGFVVLTHNLRDYELLHDAWTHWGAAPGVALPAHPGILVLQRATRRTMVGVVAEFLAAAPSLTGEAFSWSPVDGWARRVNHAWVRHR